MKGHVVSLEEWRTVQVFISPKLTGVFEVEVELGTSELRCNCRTFKTRFVCRHVRHVQENMDENGGDYAVYFPKDVTEEDLEKANQTSEDFRKFVIEKGKIEVL